MIRLLVLLENFSILKDYDFVERREIIKLFLNDVEFLKPHNPFQKLALGFFRYNSGNFQSKAFVDLAEYPFFLLIRHKRQKKLWDRLSTKYMLINCWRSWQNQGNCELLDRSAARENPLVVLLVFLVYCYSEKEGDNIVIFRFVILEI